MAAEAPLPITGGCLCRQVRYTIDAAPLAARSCWCRLCQYLGGGTAGVNLAFPAEAVAITGRLADYASAADSGAHMHRGFCPTCGTPVTSSAEERPHLLFIRAGTLDDPDLMAPEAVIWTSQAPRWATIPADIPSYTAQIPPVS
jgi:hypothetical protein